MDLASVGQRVKAHLTDVALFWAYIFLGAALMKLFGIRFTDSQLPWILSAWLMPFIVLQAYFLYRYSQSIGKCVFKIRIVDAGTFVIPGFFRTFFIRSCVGQAIRFIPMVGILDYLMATGKHRQCLHDSMANTVVVRCAT